MGSKCSSTCHSKSVKHPSISTHALQNGNNTIPNQENLDAIPSVSNPNTKPTNYSLPENIFPPLTKNKSVPSRIKTMQINLDVKKNKYESPFVPNEKKTAELRVNRSLSAMKLNREDITPSMNGKGSTGAHFFKTKTVKYFQKDEKEIPIIHSKQKKKTLKFRNSQYLNKFLIDKFELKVNFEQVPKKEGDTSVENLHSNNNLAEQSQPHPQANDTVHVVVKEESAKIRSPSIPPLKFYFKPEFLTELLGNIFELNTAPLKKYELIYEEKTMAHKMKIYCTNYTTTEKNKVNIFRSEFFVPCHPEFFQKFMNNISEQTKMDTLLDKYYIAEGFSDNTNVIYLSYKKTIISSARDFIYLKHCGKIEKNGEVFYCDTSRSIDHSEYPVIKNIVRGDIIYSGHVISLMKDEKGNDMSFCRLYSECDFKVNVPAFISKKFSKDEMKAYTERCIARIKELQQQK